MIVNTKQCNAYPHLYGAKVKPFVTGNVMAMSCPSCRFRVQPLSIQTSGVAEAPAAPRGPTLRPVPTCRFIYFTKLFFLITEML